MTEAQWQEVKSNGNLGPFVHFKEIGDELKGQFIGKRGGTDLNGNPEDIYDFQTKDGPRSVSASNKDLRDKLPTLNMGWLVSIKLVERKKVKGRPQPMKVYTISQKPSP